VFIPVVRDDEDSSDGEGEETQNDLDS
jgi:hypothetical protein